MTPEEQKKLLIEASRRYPKGTVFESEDDSRERVLSSGDFHGSSFGSVYCNNDNVFHTVYCHWSETWATIVSTPKKPTIWKKILAWAILILIGIPVIYLIVRSALALASGNGFTGWFLYLGVVAALSGWPLVIWWAIENITSNSKNEKKGD